jgi:hypothetical protein
LRDVELGLPVIKKLTLTDEEEEKVGFRTATDGSAMWEDTEYTKDIEFSRNEARWLSANMLNSNTVGWPMDPRTIELKKKLEKLAKED